MGIVLEWLSREWPLWLCRICALALAARPPPLQVSRSSAPQMESARMKTNKLAARPAASPIGAKLARLCISLGHKL